LLMVTDGKTNYVKGPDGKVDRQTADAKMLQEVKLFVARLGVTVSWYMGRASSPDNKEGANVEMLPPIKIYKLGPKEKVGQRDAQVVELSLDLTEVGARRGATQLRQTLEHPDRTIPDGFLLVEAVLSSGDAVRGMRINEDSFSIQIRDLSGRFYSFRKADLKELNALLEAQKPFVKVYNSDGIVERQVAGETVMHEQWSGKALATRQQKSTVKYVYPKEGVVGWMDNVAVPTTAPNVENAKKFLNFLMDPENIALQQKYTGYQSAIAGSNKYLSPDIGGSPEFNPPADLKISFAPSCDEKAIRAYDRIWTNLRQ